MAQNRLAGRRVAVTWSKRDDDPLAERLRALGAEVVEFPSIEIVPLAPEEASPLVDALLALERFDWVIFASANAVEQTLAWMRTASVAVEVLARPRLAAVGQATAAKLTQAVRPPDLIPARSRASALVEAVGPMVKGKRVLVPRAEAGRPELIVGLQAAGAEVSAPVAYRSKLATAESLRDLGRLLQNGQLDAVVFASPSAVESVTAALGERARWLARTLVAAIGPTTAEAIRCAGLKVDLQPNAATASDLAEVVAARLDVG